MKPEDVIWSDLLAAINALPADEGRVMHMRFIDGMNALEIAKALGMTAREVEIMLNRALDSLRPVLNPTIH